jgi:hypothetical protein
MDEVVIEVKLTPRVLGIDPANRRVLVGLFTEDGTLWRQFWAPLDPDGGGGEPLPVEGVA